MDIEKLILCVKKYPMLYDVDHAEYKSLRKKDQIWDIIGEELDENGEDLKKKWKNLRDCYARYIRSWEIEASNAAPNTTRYYKFWPWAKQMEIFKPYLKFAQINTKTGFHDNNSSDPTSTLRLQLPSSPKNTSESFSFDQQKTLQEDVVSPHRSPMTRKRKRARDQDSSANKVIKYLKEKKQSKTAVHCKDLNATELMFLGLAKTITTFSARRQASVKMRIANMVLEEELFDREEKDESELQSILAINEDGEDRKIFKDESIIGS
ncbi:transcription factor Adf-1-like [Eupeodes corollae]|uniref:transcription factor Adf-1-like n=1 Tax=Eupeodes corollae TaxID=290404 RepID=UPI002492E75A|nr:transcription factor Adf-1-like [Eupeodes corollae]